MQLLEVPFVSSFRPLCAAIALSACASAGSVPATAEAAASGSICVSGAGRVPVSWWRQSGAVYAPLTACVQAFRLMHIPQSFTPDGWVVGDLPDGSQTPPTAGPLDIWYWQPAHGDTVTYAGPVDAHAVERNGQLWIAMDAFQSLLTAFHVQTSWQGSAFIVRDPVPQVALPPSGVMSSAVQVEGDSWPEPWFYGEAGATSLARYNPLSPALPIRLVTQDGFSGEVLIEVKSHDVPGEVHQYSARMYDGRLQATVLLPFSGRLDVQVDEVQNEASLALKPIAFSRAIECAAQSLPQTRLGLLQSWFINDNESAGIRDLAVSVVRAAGLPDSAAHPSPSVVDAEIEAVSDWASRHIWYNWPAYKSGQVPWQQMTTTLSLGHGVCQDISGVAAGLLRALGIPALVVQGQALGLLGWGSHQWDEAWDGQRWLVFDPTFDAVYTSSTGIGPPVSVSHKDFDPPPSVFAQNHRGGQIANW